MISPDPHRRAWRWPVLLIAAVLVLVACEPTGTPKPKTGEAAVAVLR